MGEGKCVEYAEKDSKNEGERLLQPPLQRKFHEKLTKNGLFEPK